MTHLALMILGLHFHNVNQYDKYRFNKYRRTTTACPIAQTKYHVQGQKQKTNYFQ